MYMKKMPLFKADRSHLHHKLLRAGLSHKSAMMSIIGLSLFFCAFNITMVQFISNNFVVLLDFVLWFTMTLIFNSYVNKKNSISRASDAIQESLHVEKVGSTEVKFGVKNITIKS